MPRDDLTIDFVKSKMPQAESLDPGTITEEFIDRARNLNEEVRYMMDEIAEKDAQQNLCLKMIEDRNDRIQKWIKAHGSHTPNPKEEAYRKTIRDMYAKADELSKEKLALHKKCLLNYDKHTRALDGQIKTLYDRNEPGFQNPDELPSLIRPSAANHSAPSERSVNPAATNIGSMSTAGPSSATPSAARAAHPQIRINTNQPAHAASAPATPAASIMLNRQARESSAGPSGTAPKRGPRANSSLGSLPATSSNLARHSSVGPGTPKTAAVTGPQRAGSAGPRATSKGAGAGPGRKAGTPSVGRKKAPGGPTKSGLARMKRPAKNSPSSTGDSELSDADSASESAVSSRRGTPARVSQGADKEASHSQTHPKTKRATVTAAGDDDDDAMDVDDDEAGDDKKYCLCQNVSFGDMVACDNDDCPYEWFHWSCVGLKSEPNGTWYCPVCSAKLDKTEAKQAGTTKKGK